VNVLVLTADYPPIQGGISAVALQVSRELTRMGHTVTVVAPFFAGCNELDAAEPFAVVRFHGYGFGWFRALFMLRRSLPLIRKADLVLGINASHGGVIARLARIAYGTPYLTFAYAYEFLRFSRWSPWAALLRWVYTGARKVVAISTFTRDNLIRFGVCADNVAMVLPGAPTPALLSDKELQLVQRMYALDTRPVILAVGRFIPRKGHLTLVRALPAVLERFPGAVLVLVGEGPSLPGVVRESQRLGIREHVVFPGHVSEHDVAGLYQLCDLFALPTGSDRKGQVEGFGLVFCEAQAYGKPVIAGRSGGVVDAVIDGETGIIVEPEDPDGLAAAMIRILTDEALAERLGAAGRKRVEEELNWPIFTEAMLATAEIDPEGSAR